MQRFILGQQSGPRPAERVHFRRGPVRYFLRCFRSRIKMATPTEQNPTPAIAQMTMLAAGLLSMALTTAAKNHRTPQTRYGAGEAFSNHFFIQIPSVSYACLSVGSTLCTNRRKSSATGCRHDTGWAGFCSRSRWPPLHFPMSGHIFRRSSLC